MSKRGVNIYKRKDGRWEGRYIKMKVLGKIKYGYVFGKTFKETKEKLLKMKSQKQTDGNRAMGYEVLTVKFAGEKWLESIKFRLKNSSIVKYRNILTSYIYPNFGDIDINNITYNDVAEFCKELLICGGSRKAGLSPKTVSTVLSVLKNIFEYAAKSKSISIPDFSSIHIKQCSKPMRILSVAEQSVLNEYLYDNLSFTNIGILICMYTGLRIGEVCALKWKHISFAEQYLTVEGTVQRLQQFEPESSKTKVVVSRPKSDCSIRKVPLPDDLYSVLKNLKLSNDSFLLTGNNTILEPRTLQNRFKAVIKKCHIENANFHCLRHTFATRCIEIGVDIKSLSEILGHASVNITLNRYVHPSMEVKLKSINMLSNFLAVK